ncbi:MAG: M24 family metallopeptidase, partial [Clostridia bacterium]|nr:M24 family metallopeptidase [Clostridia bacterium]
IEDIVEELKAVKNETELKNIKNAYIKENTALIKSFYEIYNSDNITEFDVVQIIEKHRKALEGYIYPSFQTIAAYGANGAMMHYAPSENNCAKIKKEGMLLIDTGGQYWEGTTDTTRTLIMGEITREEAHNYTLVLKANLALSGAVFKKGLAGRDVDILPRSVLYKEGLDYRCGTGHGVGYLLCVHEGPQRISPLCNTPLAEGMTVTDEPGVYTEGRYGIRIENHLAVKHVMKTEYGDFLGFDVLNYCPIGTKGLEKEILSEKEIEIINEYNDKCIEIVGQYLTKEELQWLKIYTTHI